MKILYGLPTTGNGHIARAMALIPELRKHAKVDVLVSGPEYGLKDTLNPKYKMTGFTFDFNQKGRISFAKTIKSARFIRFLREVLTLDVSDYDLIVSDLDPITAWAARLQNKKSFGVGNPYMFLSKKLRKEYGVTLAVDEAIKLFAGCQTYRAINYEKTEDWFYTPIVRDDIRKAKITEDNHYTVYLNTYKTGYLVKHFNKLKELNFELFTPKVKKDKKIGNVTLKPVENKNFVKSFSSCKGFITAGGFEAASEGLYLGKKMLIIPLNAFEQKMNAKILKKLGVKTLKKIDKNFDKEVRDWVNNWNPVEIKYPDVKELIVKDILEFEKQPMREGLGLPPLKRIKDLKKVFKNFYFG